MRSSSARTPGKARTRAPAAPRPAGSAWVALGLGLLAVLLYAVHPIHTAVAATIKSPDDLLGLLSTLLALRLLVAHAATRRPPFLAASLLAYALGVLSKETGLAVLGLVPLTLWFFRTSDL